MKTAARAISYSTHDGERLSEENLERSMGLADAAHEALGNALPMPENDLGFFVYSSYGNIPVDGNLMREVMEDLVATDSPPDLTGLDEPHFDFKFYKLYGGSSFYAKGGTLDFVTEGSFEECEGRAVADKLAWWHIVDADNDEIVKKFSGACGDEDGD